MHRLFHILTNWLMVLRSLLSAKAQWLQFTQNPSDALPWGIAAWLARDPIDEVNEFYGIQKARSWEVSGGKWIPTDQYDYNRDTYIKYDMQDRHIKIVEEWFKSKWLSFPWGSFLAYKKLRNEWNDQSNINPEQNTNNPEQSWVPDATLWTWQAVQGMDDSQG